MVDKTYYFVAKDGSTVATTNPQYYPETEGYQPILKSIYAEKHRAECLEKLHKFLKRGDTIYSIVREVSRSGMSRQIDFYAIGDDKRPIYLTGYIEAVLTSYKRNKRGSLVVGGFGMDMCFHVVYNVSSAMFPDEERGGYEIKSETL